MTANQIAYQNFKENVRSNKAREELERNKLSIEDFKAHKSLIQKTALPLLKAVSGLIF